MKKMKTAFIVIATVIALSSTLFASCGMSERDAYDVGYGVGTLLRNL